MINILNKYSINLSKNRAFTLAEVLITLGVIGVVAAMTMPNLIANYKEKAQITSFKKVYSEISQVNQMLNTEYGGTWTNECNNYDDKCFRDLFSSKIKVIKSCDKPIEEGCQEKSLYLNGDELFNTINVNNDKYPSIVTSSGYSVKFRFHLSGCDTTKYLYVSSCGWFQIDTNALKGPNIVGKDIFLLFIQKDGRIVGRQVVSTPAELEDDCLKGSGDSCASLYLMK